VHIVFVVRNVLLGTDVLLRIPVTKQVISNHYWHSSRHVSCCSRLHCVIFVLSVNVWLFDIVV